MHAYTLVHLVFLTDKAKRFDQALSEQIGDDTVAAKDSNDPRIAAIAGVRGQLPSNIFIQFLAGPRDRRAGSFGYLLRAIAWSTLAVAPILLLLLFQIQFLPFHNRWVTLTHRLALVADLVLIWWLWRKILSGRAAVTPRPAIVWWRRAVGALLTVCTVLFSFGLATFPGEWQTERLAAWKPIMEHDPFRDRVMVSIHDWMFESNIDGVTRRRRWLVSSTLVLTGFSIYEGLKIDDPEKAKWHDFIFRARGRDLKGAIFDLASLPKVDFEGAQLQGASLKGAQLQGASLLGAELQGASLALAQLQGATLDSAQLQGASLAGAQLHGASLQDAVLHATDLSGAWLWRTNAPTVKDIPKPAAVWLAGASWAPSWKDVLSIDHVWDGKAYRDLLTQVEALPAGDPRYSALKNIGRLDCDGKDDTLAPCNGAAPPPGAVAWREALEAAAPMDQEAYAQALVQVLRGLVCSGGDDAIYIVRGTRFGGGFLDRLEATGLAGSGLIDDIMNKDGKDCPVATALTDADRARLLQIKKDAKKAGK